MFRKNKKCYYYNAPIIFNMNQLGIGMSVTMLPTILQIKNNFPNDIYAHCHQHHVDIIKYFIDEDNIYPFYDSNDPNQPKDKIFVGEKANDVIYYNASATIIPPHHCHPVDHFMHLWTGRTEVPIEEKNYPKFPVEKVDISKYNLPDKFIVIGPGSTKPICQLPINTIKDLINYCKSKGYDVVLLGEEFKFMIKFEDRDMPIGPIMPKLDYTDCINLINKTKLDEAIAILDKAHCYIGPEGGLMNFCGMTDTPMVIGISGWQPKMRMPYRHNELGWEAYPVTPSEELECRFCIQKTIHAKTVNVMMQCIYDDFKCVEEHMGFKNFKPQLDKIL